MWKTTACLTQTNKVGCLYESKALMGLETPLEPSTQQQAVKVRVQTAFNRPLCRTAEHMLTRVHACQRTEAQRSPLFKCFRTCGLQKQGKAQ